LSIAAAIPPAGCLDPERALDDQGDHRRHLGDMGNQHIDRDQQIGDRHERHDIFGDAGDGADAAEDHDRREDGKRDADIELVEAEGALHRIGDRIGLHRVEDEAEDEDQAEREQHRRPGRVEPLGNVEGRAAAILPVLVADLVELGERAFRVGRGHADERDHPHPEDRAGAAEIERDRDAGEIAGADARGEAGAERLERGDAALVLDRRVHHRAEHLGEVYDLNEFQPQGEEDADGQQAIDQHIAPEDGVEESNDRSHANRLPVNESAEYSI
jgi:hypothetical protein